MCFFNAACTSFCLISVKGKWCLRHTMHLFLDYSVKVKMLILDTNIQVNVRLKIISTSNGINFISQKYIF